MNDSQKARDYANQQQFRADIQQITQNFNYTIQGEEATAYLVRLFVDNFPKLHADAMRVANTCAEEMALAVLAEICNVDPGQISNLRKPSAQSALLTAQESYARTGDPDTGEADVALGRLLAKLVAQAVVEPTRSVKEIVLQRAIRTAPHLTNRQINSLSVLAILASFTFNGANPHEVISNLDNFYSSYYDGIVTRDLEYSYMESTGAGSVEVSLPAGIYPRIRDRHRPAMRKSFHMNEVPSRVTPEHRTEYIEPDPLKAGLYRARAEKMNELLNAAPNWMEMTTAVLSGGDSQIELREFIEQRMFTADELKEQIEREAPNLFRFLELLDRTGAIYFRPSAIGLILADQELSLRFPGSNLLGPIVSLDAANLDEVAHPGTSET
ncbi:LPO_1073/Vpar_1526 family protein [Mycobacterium riyadhense]|uniref:Uncharacterized protein n=1 Tax=Mycobacterium riyadhense TaxID=486698 RepID=A0A653EFP2_9MYCO|nr:LPO_1073/Vpar_1526 family protein [Mycobacterium riyadhense]VTO95535.1 hypothetical protein BIN_B_01016 [Mycobacterium riyadhense]